MIILSVRLSQFYYDLPKPNSLSNLGIFADIAPRLLSCIAHLVQLTSSQ